MRTRSLLGRLLLIGLAVLEIGCAARSQGTNRADVVEYLDRVRQLEASGPPFEKGSEPERQAIERFQGLLGDFKASGFRERVREVYGESLFFNDTLTTIRDSGELEDYLARSADALEAGTVEFLGVTSDNGNYFFRWRMSLRFKSLASGRQTESVGMSHVRFDASGRVVLHQDFWDSSAGLFEHIPVLGSMIRGIKRRL